MDVSSQLHKPIALPPEKKGFNGKKLRLDLFEHFATS
jgi:hypothetical protein